MVTTSSREYGLPKGGMEREMFLFGIICVEFVSCGFSLLEKDRENMLMILCMKMGGYQKLMLGCMNGGSPEALLDHNNNNNNNKSSDLLIDFVAHNVMNR